jgi:hypothetical protein
MLRAVFQDAGAVLSRKGRQFLRNGRLELVWGERWRASGDGGERVSVEAASASAMVQSIASRATAMLSHPQSLESVSAGPTALEFRSMQRRAKVRMASLLFPGVQPPL